MKKVLRCKHCTLVVVRWSPKNFAPPQTPSWAWDGQNVISWRWSLPLPINLVRIDAHNFELSWYETHPPTNRQGLLQSTVLQLVCSVKIFAVL